MFIDIYKRSHCGIHDNMQLQNAAGMISYNHDIILLHNTKVSILYFWLLPYIVWKKATLLSMTKGGVSIPQPKVLN